MTMRQALPVVCLHASPHVQRMEVGRAVPRHISVQQNTPFWLVGCPILSIYQSLFGRHHFVFALPLIVEHSNSIHSNADFSYIFFHVSF